MSLASEAGSDDEDSGDEGADVQTVTAHAAEFESSSRRAEILEGGGWRLKIYDSILVPAMGKREKPFTQYIVDIVLKMPNGKAMVRASCSASKPRNSMQEAPATLRAQGSSSTDGRTASQALLIRI